MMYAIVVFNKIDNSRTTSDWTTKAEIEDIYRIMSKPSMFGNENFRIEVITKDFNDSRDAR